MLQPGTNSLGIVRGSYDCALLAIGKMRTHFSLSWFNQTPKIVQSIQQICCAG